MLPDARPRLALLAVLVVVTAVAAAPCGFLAEARKRP